MPVRHRLLSRRALFAAGVTVALPLSTAAASPVGIRLTLPVPTGPYPVGTATLHLVDRSRTDPWKPDRRREVMATVSYPAAVAVGRRAPWLSTAMTPLVDRYLSAPEFLDIARGSVDWGATRRYARENAPVDRLGGALPVVLFSPGFSAPRELYTTLADDLASRGYVVVSMSHTFESDAVEFPGGRVETALPIDWSDMRTEKKALETRVADTRFVLDELTRLSRGYNSDSGRRPLPLGLAGALDLPTVGMFGHSYGGFTTGEAMLHDRRISAGVNLDGAMGYHAGAPDYLPGEAVKRGLDRPVLLMGASEFVDGLAVSEHHHRDPSDPSWTEFWATQRGWKRDLFMRDGAHFSYCDLQGVSARLAAVVKQDRLVGMVGSVDPGQALAAQYEYLDAFFALHLRGTNRHLLDGDSPRYPAVRFV